MKTRLSGGFILVLLALVALAFQIAPKVSPRTFTVATTPLPVLLPHAHTLSDKISDVHHGIALDSLPIEVPETMWVTEITTRVVNAPDTVVHHARLKRMTVDQSGKTSGTALFIFGQETPSKVSFPAPTGMLLLAGEELVLEVVLHNPVPPLGEGLVYNDVAVEVTLHGVPNNRGRHVPLYFNLLDIHDGGSATQEDITFAVPPQSKNYTRSSKGNPEGDWGGTHLFLKDGWIVTMGAHMHPWEGGKRVDAYLNDAHIGTLTTYPTNPSIPWDFETKLEPLYARIHRGDELSLRATYDNPSDTPVAGAMGMLGFFYTQDEFSLALPLHEAQWTIQGWFIGAKNALAAFFE